MISTKKVTTNSWKKIRKLSTKFRWWKKNSNSDSVEVKNRSLILTFGLSSEKSERSLSAVSKDLAVESFVPDVSPVNAGTGKVMMGWNPRRLRDLSILSTVCWGLKFLLISSHNCISLNCVLFFTKIKENFKVIFGQESLLLSSERSFNRKF